MITISEYLGYLFGQVTQARAIADSETVRVAELYAKDDLLKHFSVPRFRIPELELSIPMSIGKAEYATAQNSFTKEKFEKKYADSLSQSLRTLGAKFQFEDVTFNEQRSLISELSDEILENSSSGEKLILTYHPKVFGNTISQARIEKIDKKVYLKLMEETQKELVDFFLNSQNSVTKSALSSILINPETNIIKSEANEISVFQIKAKFVEEGVYIKSIKDENGKEKKVLNFE